MKFLLRNTVWITVTKLLNRSRCCRGDTNSDKGCSTAEYKSGDVNQDWMSQFLSRWDKLYGHSSICEDDEVLIVGNSCINILQQVFDKKYGRNEVERNLVVYLSENVDENVGRSKKSESVY